MSGYRFVVSSVGEPAEDRLYLPISDNMKRLAEAAPLGRFKSVPEIVQTTAH